MGHLVQLTFGGRHVPHCYSQCRQLLFFILVSSVPCGQERQPFTIQERKPRQEVGPELMVAELAFKPRGPDSRPGALLLPSLTT